VKGIVSFLMLALGSVLAVIGEFWVSHATRIAWDVLAAWAGVFACAMLLLVGGMLMLVFPLLVVKK